MSRTASVVVLPGVLTTSLILLVFEQRISPAEEPPGRTAPLTKAGEADDTAALEGLWYGSWGGGDFNGVISQPVVAELFIKADHAELSGFPDTNWITGMVEVDTRVGRIRITPTNSPDGQQLKAVDYAYRLDGRKMTLIAPDRFPVTLEKHSAVENPLANATVEFVSATGINDAGDLLVSEFTVLRVGRAGTTYFRPESRRLTTARAAVFLVEEAGLRKVTIDQARGMIRETTPVALAYRRDEESPRRGLHRLWREAGKPAPDGRAVLRTFTQVLRPGTLVFVLSARENVVAP